MAARHARRLTQKASKASSSTQKTRTSDGPFSNTIGVDTGGGDGLGGDNHGDDDDDDDEDEADKTPDELRLLMQQLRWWKKHSNFKGDYYAFYVRSSEYHEEADHHFKKDDRIAFSCTIPGCRKPGSTCEDLDQHVQPDHQI